MNLHKNFLFAGTTAGLQLQAVKKAGQWLHSSTRRNNHSCLNFSHQYCNIGQLKSTPQNPNLMRSSFPNCCITGNEENFPTKNGRTSQLWTFHLHLKPGNYLGVMEAIVALWMCHQMNVPQFRRYVPLL